MGAKKIQQVLAKEGVLHKFFPSDHEVRSHSPISFHFGLTCAQRIARLRKCFAGLYSLDAGECEEAVKSALAHPEDYVMKPQREGGGIYLLFSFIQRHVRE